MVGSIHWSWGIGKLDIILILNLLEQVIIFPLKALDSLYITAITSYLQLVKSDAKRSPDQHAGLRPTWRP
jgi:hypothetical protein